MNGIAVLPTRVFVQNEVDGHANLYRSTAVCEWVKLGGLGMRL